VSVVAIRSALVHEQHALEELQRRASLANAGDRDAILAHPDAIEVPLGQIVSANVFVLESDGALAGFAALSTRPDGDAELEALFVDPHLQRRGFGRSLVDHCAQIALTRGSTALHVIGNPHAQKFYLSCGFVCLGTTETRFGPGLLMRKRLLP
jgi:GNAT superfamily N-acetyltransferase